MDFANDLVQVETTPAVATVSLNDPDKLNALSPELAEELHESLAEFHDDGDRAILLCGNGRATCAGVDTVLFESDDYYEEFPDFDALMHEIFEQLRTYPRPVVLAGKGAVIGAAFTFGLLSDLLILGEETTFWYPEVEAGLFSPQPPEILRHVAGQGAAMEAMLTAEPVAPTRAVELGMAYRVVPEADVDDEARQLVDTIAEYPADTVAKLKDVLRYEPPGE